MKKSINFSNMHFVEAMREYNPLAFKKPDGVVCIYKDWTACYLEMLERIYAQAPRGYFDVILFLIDNYQMQKSYAETFAKNFYSTGLLSLSDDTPKYVVEIDWRHFEEKLRRFAVGLHNVTETKFQPDRYAEACRLLVVNHPRLAEL